MAEIDLDMQKWCEILEQSRQQVEQWKASGDEARAAIINHVKAIGDNTGEVNGVERYRVVKYTTKKFDKETFVRDWAALNKALTTEVDSFRVEIVPSVDAGSEE